jgi:hypothetical protein
VCDANLLSISEVSYFVFAKKWVIVVAKRFLCKNKMEGKVNSINFEWFCLGNDTTYLTVA